VSSHLSPCAASNGGVVCSPIREFIDGVLLASVADDPVGVRTHLDAAALALGLGACMDDVLLPAMREIGTRWQRGMFGIDSERLTTETVRGWLEQVSLGAPEPLPTAPLLLACGPSDQHSIALEALCMLLRYQQQPCRMLGPRTSTRVLALATAANQPSGIVLVSHLRAGRLGATQALRAVTGLGAELFYAGGAFATARLRRHVPGTYLGTNIQVACAAILAATTHQV
jgi:MerR family transcriptional regulator, light-induced transcriptional regulator